MLATSIYHLTPGDVSKINSSKCNLILLALYWSFLHCCCCKQYDRLDGNCPFVSSLSTSAVSPEERVIDGEEAGSESSDHLHVHLAVVSRAIIAMSHECS